MRNYQFNLCHTSGPAHPAVCGLIENHGILFADDGFGNYISVDTRTAVYSALS